MWPSREQRKHNKDNGKDRMTSDTYLQNMEQKSKKDLGEVSFTCSFLAVSSFNVIYFNVCVYTSSSVAQLAVNGHSAIINKYTLLHIILKLHGVHFPP